MAKKPLRHRHKHQSTKKPATPVKRQAKPILSYDRPTAITPIEYVGLQRAYDFFNETLFADEPLPDCMITYQRRANSMGYFAPDRFSGRTAEFAKRDELALNPDAFISCTDKQICQTLTHEMVHVWQQAHGTPPSRGYHDREWSAKMKEIGLQPSSTGMVGGKETGQRMSDYVIAGGRFEQAFDRLAKMGWRLNMQSAHQPGKKGGTRESKTAFLCSQCGQNAWGRPALAILCEPCGLKMIPKAPKDKAAANSFVPSTAADAVSTQLRMH